MSESLGSADGPAGAMRPDHQLTVMRVDLSRFTSSGHGTLFGPGVDEFDVGQVIAVTDDGADTLAATVVAVRPGAAELQVHWNRVQRRA